MKCLPSSSLFSVLQSRNVLLKGLRAIPLKCNHKGDSIALYSQVSLWEDQSLTSISANQQTQTPNQIDQPSTNILQDFSSSSLQHLKTFLAFVSAELSSSSLPYCNNLELSYPCQLNSVCLVQFFFQRALFLVLKVQKDFLKR